MGKQEAEATSFERCTTNKYCYFCCIESKCMNWTNCGTYADSREKKAKNYIVVISLIIFLTISFLVFYGVIIQTSHNKFLKIIESKEIEKSIQKSNQHDRSESGARKKEPSNGGSEEFGSPAMDFVDDGGGMSVNMGFQFGSSGDGDLNDYYMLEKIDEVKLRKSSSHEPGKASKNQKPKKKRGIK